MNFSSMKSYWSDTGKLLDWKSDHSFWVSTRSFNKISLLISSNFGFNFWIHWSHYFTKFCYFSISSFKANYLASSLFRSCSSFFYYSRSLRSYCYYFRSISLSWSIFNYFCSSCFTRVSCYIFYKNSSANFSVSYLLETESRILTSFKNWSFCAEIS